MCYESSLSASMCAGALEKGPGGYKIKLKLGSIPGSEGEESIGCTSKLITRRGTTSGSLSKTAEKKWFLKKSRYCLFSPRYAVSISNYVSIVVYFSFVS